MLIPFDEIVTKYGLPKGIIHIGAHLAEERISYKKFNIENLIWIEANAEIFERIQHFNSEKELVLNYAVSDFDNEISQFNITNNGESSSLLDLELHINHHPHIHVIKQISIITKRMDSIIPDYDIDISKFNFLNIDVQGAELKVLKGFGELLNNIEYIYTEINSNYLYKNCALIEELDYYLASFNFKRKETKMTQFEWGDALYVRN